MFQSQKLRVKSKKCKINQLIKVAGKKTDVK